MLVKFFASKVPGYKSKSRSLCDCSNLESAWMAWQTEFNAAPFARTMYPMQYPMHKVPMLSARAG